MADPRVCIGLAVGAHGIRGAVRVKCFTDLPQDFVSYGPVEDEAGARRFAARLMGVSKGLALVALEGVADRDAAEALRGTRFYVSRSRLPKGEEDEVLVADLIGCRAETPAGEPLGVVKGVYDFGAGEVIEIAGEKGEMMVPFTAAFVPQVLLSEARLVVEPPVYVEDVEEGEKRQREMPKEREARRSVERPEATRTTGSREAEEPSERFGRIRPKRPAPGGHLK